MKISSILFLLLSFFSIPSIAQLISTTPSFPKDTSNVSIVVDCTKGNQGLFGYGNTNDVYVHVGVITNLSTGPTDWKYVKFTWGSTTAQAQASSLGNNKYQYIINNPRTFFGVPAGETILKITFLLRNGSGSAVQRNSDGSDMYIPVYSNALAGKYLEPLMQPIFVPIPEPINKIVGERVKVSYLTNNLADISLFFNGTAVNAVSSSNSIIDSPLIAASGAQQIVVRSTAGAVTISDTISFFVAPPTNILPQPPGTVDGINYEAGDTSAILVLHAPSKARITVIGDFNNWTENSAYVMNKTPDGFKHWIRITGLTPGTEYAYQYLVEGTLKIADPYAQKLLDQQNDGFITTVTYPNLKPYPAGKTTGIVSVLQTAEPGYTWQINNFQRPDKRGLVIYELLLRDFIAAHDFKTLKDTLAYLKNLGVNAIEVMPFNEFEGNISWGYNTSFYFAPDKYYGPKSRLKEFIDECHKQGIAVIMDMVLNHSFGQSPMVQLYFDNSTGRPAANNPWFNPTARHAFNVGYDMNHESMATRYLVSRVLEHWLKEYRLDGFRFDLSKGFTQVNTCDANGNNCNVGAWGNFDASRVAIWKRYYDTCQLKSPGSYVILEHFADNSEEKELSDYGMMLWGNMNHAFNEATMGFLAGSNFEGAMSTARGWTQPALIAYMESHDEERLMYKNLNFGNSSGSYNVKDLNTGLRRNELAASFFFMMPGPKMIWQFGEQGYDYSINYCTNGTVNTNCRLDPKPIKWDYLQNTARKRLTDVYNGLLKLRAHPLYRTAFLTNRVDYNLAAGFKWLRLTTDTSNILVVGNFDVNPASGQVTFQNAGTWYNYFTGQTINATGAAQTINLQPGEYAVYVNRNVTNILTPVREVVYEGKKIRLAVSPNPVKKFANIEYEIPESGQVSISVMDGMGRKVSQLFTGFRAKGVYKITLQDEFLLNRATKGVYFLQLEFRSKKLVQKLVLQ